jgi:hypothetical protein
MIWYMIQDMMIWYDKIGYIWYDIWYDILCDIDDMWYDIYIYILYDICDKIR